MNDNQHYISKAHLDKFVHPSSTQNILYPYAKGKGALRPKGTKRLASADHFYRQVESGTYSNRLDEARKKSEELFFASGKRTAAPLAQCIFDNGYLPTAADRIMLEGAAAFLRCGAPVQIHNTAMISLLALQATALNQLNTDEEKARYKAEFGDEAENAIREHREAIVTGQVVVDVGEENWKQLGFDSFQFEGVWIDALSRMGLTVCRCHPKSFFITSDNPVIYVSHLQKDNPGLALPDTEVWFPISYNRGLLWNWRHSGVNKTTLGHSATRVYNRHMITAPQKTDVLALS